MTGGGRLPPVVVIPCVRGEVVVWREVMSGDEPVILEFETPTANAGRERDLGNMFSLTRNALVVQLLPGTTRSRVQLLMVPFFFY